MLAALGSLVDRKSSAMGFKCSILIAIAWPHKDCRHVLKLKILLSHNHPGLYQLGLILKQLQMGSLALLKI